MGSLKDMLSKAKAEKGEKIEMGEDPEESGETEETGSDAGLSAMKLFSEASSPEKKLEAFKLLLDACC